MWRQVPVRDERRIKLMRRSGYDPTTSRTLVVRLEPFRGPDIPRLLSWVDSPEALFTWAGRTFEWPLDARQLDNHLKESLGPTAPRHLFKAVDGRTAEPVGHVELCQINRVNLSATACRVLVAPERRGAGVGMAIMHAACDFAFGTLGVHRLDLRVFPWNRGAIRLYQRLGFVEEGVLRDTVRHGGRYESFLVMSMLEAEWPATR